MVKCRICGHKWEPRAKEPVACPKCKRYDWKEPIKIKTLLLLISISSTIFLLPLGYAASWTTLTQSDFNLGTYFNTSYNTTGSYVMLNNTTSVVYSPFGNYTSKVFDAGTSTWNNISWIEGVPYGEELPDNNRVEAVLGGANMTGNVLLMHMNGANGSTTFVDNSSGNKAITANGNVYIDTSQSKFGGASGKFDGTGDYLSTPDSVDWYFGTGDFTIEFWVRFASVATAERGLFNQYFNSSSYNYFEINFNSVWANGSAFLFYTQDAAINTNWKEVPKTIVVNTWYHVALVRSGNNFQIFLNGVQCGSTYTDSDAVPDLAGSVYIGDYGGGAHYLNGSLDEFAIYKNRSLSTVEVLNHYKRGALRLNITTRSCNDAACSGESWNETHNNATLSNLKEQNNQYFQYKAQFETDNTPYTPELYNVTIKYTLMDLPINTNATTVKRGDFINITISSESAVTANITKPNGAVTWLTTPTSKGSNIYETNYTFASSDPPGSYMIGANSSTTNTNTTNVTMNNTIKITLESDKMSSDRKIITRSLKNIQAYGTATYADNSAYASKTLTFTYGTTTAGTNTTDASGNYNFTFQVTYDGNYTFTVTASDNSNNTGTNSSILTIRSRPEYVKYRMTFHINNSNANNVYSMGTASLTNQTMNNTNINNLQYASNLSHYYVCSYDNVDYTNGILLAMMHSYKGSYLDYINFSSTASNPNYTLEIRSKPEGSNLLLAYTKGTCELISSKIQLVESQAIPSNPLATFSFGTPSTYHYEIRALYDKIDINGTDTWTTGTTAVCVEKTAVSNQRPVVYVRRC